MAPSNEDQSSGFGYERQNRRSAAPDPTEAAPDANLPATDAREDFASDPADQKAPEAASAAPAAASAAKDGPKAPEPVQAAPAASYAPPGPAATVVLPEATRPEPPFVAYPELHEEHPARLPPAARPVRQGG